MGDGVEYLRVKNWEKFQHYHNRPNAPYWIKMYPDLLVDYAFLELSEADRYKLMAIWLLASKLRNKIRNEPKYVARMIGASRVDLGRFIELGFLEPFTEEDDTSRQGLDVGRTQSRTEEESDESRADGEEVPADISDPVVRLIIAIGSHADDGTERVIRKYAAGLSEGDVAYATECCRGPGVKNRARVAVDALKKRADERRAA